MGCSGDRALPDDTPFRPGARFFSNASNITALPTTTLEEMAIAETVEMCRTLEQDFQLRPSKVLLNLASPMVEASGEAVEKLSKTVAESTDPALRFAFDRGMLERQRAVDLRAELNAPTVAVERAHGVRSDLDLLVRLGAALAAHGVAA
jgi:hypothetical protein